MGQHDHVTQESGNPRPTALEVVQNNDVEGKLVDKVVVITGATSGIGIETAKAMAATGATLFLTAHNDEEEANGRSKLAAILYSSHVSLVRMDLASFASVRAAAATILAKSQNRVHILINNAGVVGLRDLKLSPDGYEVHWATNYLGHFLLFQLLKPALLQSSTPGFNSRVVVVSSAAHRTVMLNPSHNYDFQQGGYGHEQAYANSKLATTYMANQIERLYGHQGLHALSLHPGGINTNLSRNLGQEFVDLIMKDERLRAMLKTAEQGAATTVTAAIGKEWEGKGGRYLEDCKEAVRGEDDGQVFGVGYVKQTYDENEEKRLWNDTRKIFGIED